VHRKRIILGLVVAAAALTFAASAVADPQVAVNASVTPQLVSIQITGGSSLDFGSQTIGASGVGPVDGSVVTIYNDGNVGVSLSLQGSDAQNTGSPYNSWSLSTSSGADTFAWALSPQWGGSTTYFTPGYASYMMSLSPGQSVASYPYLDMPTSTSYAGTYAWSGTIIASP
jgi:hypothetical protein